ncbi:ABC transporter permease [Limnochorda pilosa]|uniref:Peptide ABC transporter permease n=1 Tax=Limnochorda pilosa TaxID=1555112 RepID=A0A0K2SLI2_LIMPI|nr:ABC transporter permease [Limnochorda pilosa]BAS27867.1 peptide ABC transporter permease [Limnochorda pilosa]
MSEVLAERVQTQVSEGETVSNARRFWRTFRRHRLGMVGLGIVGALVIVAFAAPYLAPHDPLAQNILGARLHPPSAAYPLGTDELGRDLLSRLIYGARISLRIGIVAEGVALLIGSLVGALAGYLGGRFDDLLMRVTEIFMAIPSLLFLIAVVAILEPTVTTIALALGSIGWPSEARIMRSQVLALKNLEYVTAAHAIGVPGYKVLLRHIIPNALSPMIVVGTLGTAGAILSEATLSFLGLGIQQPIPSWGTMVNTGQSYIFNAWWYAIFPGLAIMVTVLGFNFVGDALRDALDPNRVTQGK